MCAMLQECRCWPRFSKGADARSQKVFVSHIDPVCDELKANGNAKEKKKKKVPSGVKKLAQVLNGHDLTIAAEQLFSYAVPHVRVDYAWRNNEEISSTVASTYAGSSYVRP
jgi:hypothetical protein